MLNFSLRHNLHVLVTGLKSGILDSKIFQLTLGSPPKSFSVQKWVERLVDSSGSLYFMLLLCFAYLFLKFFASPT